MCVVCERGRARERERMREREGQRERERETEDAPHSIRVQVVREVFRQVDLVKVVHCLKKKVSKS